MSKGSSGEHVAIGPGCVVEESFFFMIGLCKRNLGQCCYCTDASRFAASETVV